MARKLRNWIDSFDQYTSGMPSPDIFRKWGAISAVAGALERKVWTRTRMGDLFPNMYVVIVAPAGVGKSVITNTVREFWAGLEDHYVSSDSVTKASLVDELKMSERKGVITAGGGLDTFLFHSLKILSNELGVLIPGYDNEFMNTLTHLYDNHPYSERRRSKDLHFKLEKPQLNLLAATTPSYLNDVMPVGAWDQGFISRVIMVYSGKTQIRELFGEEVGNKDLQRKLQADLVHIGKLYGKMSFEEDAVTAISEWHKAEGPPVPDHPRLVHYCTRRTAHLLKLCMVASAAESDDLVIRLEHFTQALDWLIEAESYMPDIFKAMSNGGDSNVIKETWHYAYQLHMKEKKPILENRLILFIQGRTPSHNVMRILEVMERGGLLRKEQISFGLSGFVPVPPQ